MSDMRSRSASAPPVRRPAPAVTGAKARALSPLAAAVATSCAGDVVPGDDQGAAGPDAAAPRADAAGAPETCHDWLEERDVLFSAGEETPGVDDPVVVATPIAGIEYRVAGREERRDELFMDCELARSLVLAAPYFEERDIVEVADLGVYNYRCIGGGDPDDGCPDGLSQHARARAIDIAGLTTADGAFLSVEEDWVRDPDDVPTCEADPEGEENALLHELMCELYRDGVWNIVLTPNYNEAHRDHFHVDLTEDGDFIRSRGDPDAPAR